MTVLVALLMIGGGLWLRLGLDERHQQCHGEAAAVMLATEPGANIQCALTTLGWLGGLIIAAIGLLILVGEVIIRLMVWFAGTRRAARLITEVAKESTDGTPPRTARVAAVSILVACLAVLATGLLVKQHFDRQVAACETPAMVLEQWLDPAVFERCANVSLFSTIGQIVAIFGGLFAIFGAALTYLAIARERRKRYFTEW